MKYTGRIVITTVGIVFILAIRAYGIIYYDYPPNQLPIFGTIIVITFWWMGTQYDKVKFYSEKDVLTKLYNRRFVTQAFPKMLALVKRKNEKCSLFLLDIDHFKQINDKYGHETGDRVLQYISGVFLQNTRESEIVARWAGDEFLLVAPFTDENSAKSMISRINNALMKSKEEIHMEISVSIGVSIYPNDAQSLDDLLRIADQNMYEAKSRGRAFRMVSEELGSH